MRQPFVEADSCRDAIGKFYGQVPPEVLIARITRPEDAQRMLDAGAALVQLYTGFIYRGPALVAECAEALADR